MGESRAPLPGQEDAWSGLQEEILEHLSQETRRFVLSEMTAAVQLSAVKHPVVIRIVFHIPIKEKKGLPGLLLWNMLLL